MHAPSLSVIIPHYNIPNLLLRCLRSISISPDIQVIVVDDRSDDSEKYVEKYPELSRPYLEFYTTDKGGSAGRARNVGIEHAKGKWLTFIDADDMFTDSFNYLFDKIKNEDSDAVFFQTKSVMSDNLDTPSERNLFKYHFSHFFETGDDKPLRYEFDAPWGKFIKKDIIEKYHLRFDEIRYSNDTFFSAALGIKAKTIKVFPDIIYIVTERAGSLSYAKKKCWEEWKIRYDTALRVQNYFDKCNIDYRRYAFVDFLNDLWTYDKGRYFSEIMRLSFKNMVRVAYCQIRKILNR